MAALTFGNDVGDCLLTHVPDGAKSETHHVSDGGVGVHGFVDIRREHLDAHAARLAQHRAVLSLFVEAPCNRAAMNSAG